MIIEIVATGYKEGPWRGHSESELRNSGTQKKKSVELTVYLLRAFLNPKQLQIHYELFPPCLIVLESFVFYHLTKVQKLEVCHCPMLIVLAKIPSRINSAKQYWIRRDMFTGKTSQVK